MYPIMYSAVDESINTFGILFGAGDCIYILQCMSCHYQRRHTAGIRQHDSTAVCCCRDGYVYVHLAIPHTKLPKVMQLTIYTYANRYTSNVSNAIHTYGTYIHKYIQHNKWRRAVQYREQAQ